MKKLVIGSIIVMLAGTACWPFDGDDALARMQIRRGSGDGRVEVHRDGEIIVVKDEANLEPRDVIVTKDDATAELQLEEGRRALIAPDSQHLIVDTSTIEAQQGSLLARASAPMTISFAGAEANLSSGLFRVDRALGASRAATFEGRVRLSTPGQRLNLSPLFQTSVSAADFDEPDPYRLNEKDLWDNAYLADVLALDKELGQIAAGLASQVGKTRPTVGYFRGLAKGQPTGFMAGYVDSRHGTEDLLIGFTVGLEADGALKMGVDRAFELFDDGARWGVAATIMDVNERPLIAALEGIIEATGVASAEPGEAPDFSTGGALASGPGEAPPDGGGGGGGGDPGAGDPDDPGGGGNDPDPPEDCEDFVDCTAQDVQEQNPLASPSPSPSSLLDDLPPP